jgi:hypothetical protein
LFAIDQSSDTFFLVDNFRIDGIFVNQIKPQIKGNGYYKKTDNISIVFHLILNVQKEKMIG